MSGFILEDKNFDHLDDARMDGTARCGERD
jgi:hypothetical protein